MRRLIVCADGTWKSERDEERGQPVTNVVHLKRAIPLHDHAGVEQVVFYDEGVGTGGLWKRLLGGATGEGLAENILECYAFLVREHREGDEIYLFGFSRGAYTVRSLAGMVRKCGILREDDPALLRKAYDFYRDRSEETHPARERAQAFRREHSKETPIRCIGVWDTVGSLGIPTSGPLGWWSRRKHGFHDVRLSSHVQNGFHAIAVDERRRPFSPALWEVRESDRAADAARQTIEQRWFVGVHSNVGGGYTDAKLSNLALKWVAERARSCGLELNAGFEEALDCDCGGRLHDSMTLLYRLFGIHERPIHAARRDPRTGEPMLTYEVIDDSARMRMDRADLSPKYQPRNLLRALEALGS